MIKNDYLTVGELKNLYHFRANDGGFQRPLDTNRVKEIAEFLINDPVGKLPPLWLGRIKGDRTGTRYCVDGQHRSHGGIRAGKPLKYTLDIFNSEEEIRQAFIKANFKSKKLSFEFLIQNSNTPVAKQTRALAAAYGASSMHIVRLGRGLLSGKTYKYWDLSDPNLAIPDEFVRKIRTIMDTWTRDKRWTPEVIPPINPEKATRAQARKIVEVASNAYCCAGLLQAVGCVVRALQLNNQRKIREVVQVAQKQLKTGRATFKARASKNSADFWAEVADRLFVKVSRKFAQE